MRYLNTLFILLFISPAVLSVQDVKLPDKAMCAVCLLRGETKPEKVKAYSEYEGKTYYFCAKGCKKEFDSQPAAYMPPELPRPAPQFVVETLEGADVALKDYEGKLLLLDFWATWCAPCVKIMPELQKLHDTYSENDFLVVGVSIDEDKDAIKKIRKFIKKRKIAYPILFDAKNNPAWHQFNVKAIPAMFLINGEGQIIVQWTGKIDHDMVKAKIEEVLGG